MTDDPATAPASALLAGRTGLLVRLNCRSGMRPALLDVINRYADGLAEEPGTEVFMVSVDPAEADVVWLYEVFHDDQAQLAHRASSGFARMMEEIPPLLSDPPAVLRLNPLRLSMQSAILDDTLSL